MTATDPTIWGEITTKLVFKHVAANGDGYTLPIPGQIPADIKYDLKITLFKCYLDSISEQAGPLKYTYGLAKPTLYIPFTFTQDPKCNYPQTYPTENMPDFVTVDTQNSRLAVFSADKMDILGLHVFSVTGSTWSYVKNTESDTKTLTSQPLSIELTVVACQKNKLVANN